MKKSEKIVWTPEMDARLIELYPENRNAEISELMGVSLNSVSSRAKRLRLKKTVFYWKPEEDDKLRELYPETTNAELSKILGRTERAVGARAFILQLHKTEEFKREHSSVTYFPKGHVPFNKGRKISEFISPEVIERMKATRFKKGQSPHNELPLGSVRLSKEGYIEIKTDMNGKRAVDRWTPKHRIVWERCHRRKVPAGHVVMFKDGDKRNFDICNLELISRAENAKRNKSFMSPEMKRLYQLKGALTRQLNKVKNRKENGESNNTGT